MKRRAPLPSPITSPTDASGAYDRNLYAYLKSIEAALIEKDAQIETLRVALNQARQTPTTTYPAIPEF